MDRTPTVRSIGLRTVCVEHLQMTVALIAASLFRALLLPPALFFTLLVIGWVIRRRAQRAGCIMQRMTLAFAYVFCTSAGADLLVAPLEAMTAPLPTGASQGAQAIVVLAAGRLPGPEYDNLSIPDFVALARLRYAARLQHFTGLPILVSGGGRLPGRDPHARQSLADGMARALREDFKTPVAWVEDGSETTLDNAVLSRRLLQRSGIDHILLVTDAMSMPRARQVFARAGFHVTEAPTIFLWAHDPGFTWLQRQHPLSFFPSAEGMRQSYYATYEWIGLAWYRLRGVV